MGMFNKQDAMTDSVLPQKGIDKKRKNASSLSQSAILAVDRNRWFLFSLALLLVVVILGLKVSSLSSQLSSNYRLAFVKMYPSGAWDVEFETPTDEVNYIPNMVNSKLTEWVEKRYSEAPETIRRDYGFVNLFLSPRLSQQFVSPDGFNAAQKAADIQSSKGRRTVYKVNAIDHFDKDPNSMFSSMPGITYSTNFFTSKSIELPNGQLVGGRADKRIVRVEWRLMSVPEMTVIANQKGGVDWIRSNPIGIEIINYNEVDDVSDNNLEPGV